MKETENKGNKITVTFYDFLCNNIKFLHPPQYIIISIINIIINIIQFM